MKARRDLHGGVMGIVFLRAGGWRRLAWPEGSILHILGTSSNLLGSGGAKLLDLRWAGIFRFAAPREVPVFGKFPRRALGCQGVGKTLAFYGVEAGHRGKEIETVTVGVAGDDSRGAAGNFDDIGVGHKSFLPRASLKSS